MPASPRCSSRSAPELVAAAIKSALMTTGKPDAQRRHRRFRAAVVPTMAPARSFRTVAANPGLVFDAGFNDWLAFLCGTGQLSCVVLRVDLPSTRAISTTRRSPSAHLAGAQTVTRTVTNVGASAETYTVSRAQAWPGSRWHRAVGVHDRSGRQTKSFSVHVHDERQRGAQRVHARRPSPDRQRRPRGAQPGRDPAGCACGADAGQSGSYNVTFGYTGAFTCDGSRPGTGGRDGWHRGGRPDRMAACSLTAPNAQLITLSFRPARPTRGSRCSTPT